MIQHSLCFSATSEHALTLSGELIASLCPAWPWTTSVYMIKIPLTVIVTYGHNNNSTSGETAHITVYLASNNVIHSKLLCNPKLP